MKRLILLSLLASISVGFLHASTADALTPEAARVDILSGLSKENALEVLLYLDVRDLVRCEGVCKGWQALVSDHQLWRKQARKMAIDTSQPFSDGRTWKHLIHGHYRLVDVLVNIILERPGGEIFAPLDCAFATMGSFPPGYSNSLESTFDLMMPIDTAGVAVIDRFCRMGSEYCAFKCKVEGLQRGDFGYPRNLAAAQNFIEEQVIAGNKAAIKLKFCALENGDFGYQEDRHALDTLINEQLAIDNQDAVPYKIASLVEGVDRHEGCVAQHAFIEQQVAAGSCVAKRRKLTGLLLGEYGYELNLGAARNFIEEQAAAGEQAFIWEKIICLLGGNYGYETNVAAARNFIEDQVVAGNQYCVKYKMQGLCSGQIALRKIL